MTNDGTTDGSITESSMDSDVSADFSRENWIRRAKFEEF